MVLFNSTRLFVMPFLTSSNLVLFESCSNYYLFVFFLIMYLSRRPYVTFSNARSPRLPHSPRQFNSIRVPLHNHLAIELHKHLRAVLGAFSPVVIQ